MQHIETTLQGYGYKPLLTSRTIVVEGLQRTAFRLCSLGIVPEGSEGRQTQGGKMIPGPWGFATTHAIVIDNFGGSAREADEAPYRLKVGEPFTADGLPGIWTLESPRHGKLDGDGARLVEYRGEGEHE
jgi:hypothetical protein